MGATVLDIADAVVTVLNGASLTPSFTAVRDYVPVYDLQKDLGTLQVTVVPHTLDWALLARNSDDFTYDIDMALQVRIPKTVTTVAERIAFCDPYVLLTEAITDLFRGRPLEALTGVDCMAGKNAPIYDPQQMDELRVFATLITLSFKMVRTR